MFFFRVFNEFYYRFCNMFFFFGVKLLFREVSISVVFRKLFFIVFKVLVSFYLIRGL